MALVYLWVSYTYACGYSCHRDKFVCDLDIILGACMATEAQKVLFILYQILNVYYEIQ